MYAIEFETELVSDHIKIPQFERLRDKHIKVIVLADENALPKAKPSYDFSDLQGKLKWHGNALVEQQDLRSEW